MAMITFGLILIDIYLAIEVFRTAKQIGEYEL